MKSRLWGAVSACYLTLVTTLRTSINATIARLMLLVAGCLVAATVNAGVIHRANLDGSEVTNLVMNLGNWSAICPGRGGRPDVLDGSGKDPAGEPRRLGGDGPGDSKCSWHCPGRRSWAYLLHFVGQTLGSSQRHYQDDRRNGYLRHGAREWAIHVLLQPPGDILTRWLATGR